MERRGLLCCFRGALVARITIAASGRWQRAKSWFLMWVAGMVITVEPWYYNHDQQLVTFVEAVILITPKGHEI